MSWFDRGAPRSDEEAVFLDTLRSRAAGWDLDVAPEDTSALTVLAPLYVDVSIPGCRTAPTGRPFFKVPTGSVVQLG